MKCCRIFIFIVLPLFVSAQQTINGTITHGGLQRSYILYVPDSYTPGTPAPLVLNFHGYTSTAFEQMFYGDFRPIADTAGFLVVHPMGTLDLLGNPHWNVGWGLSTVDDVGFTSALIDSLSSQYDINQDRVYSTGMSNGGFMSYKLACELSHRIAAIASVTGSMNINQSATCNSQHPMPVMEIHGTADGTVAYGGSVIFASIENVLAYWVGFNSCDTPPDITVIPDTDISDGCTAEHQLFPNGDNGVVVEHYKIINGQHTWPGTTFGGVGTNQDIDASQEIWRFFSRYDIHGLINSTSVGDQVNQSSTRIYPNPATTFITVETGIDKQVHYTLSSLLGQKLNSGTISSRFQEINVASLPSGMYLLNLDEVVYKFYKQE